MNYKTKLAEIEIFVFDYDGVFTDGVVLLFPDGSQVRQASTRDGYAVQWAVKQGLKIAHERLFDQSIIKVFFAASQDIEIFYKIFNKVPKPIYDLQLCISLISKNSSLSYSLACRNFLAININKSNQFVDWRKRPLSRGKVKYAINDVKYLIPLYNKLNLKINFKKKILNLRNIHEKLINPNTYSEKATIAWKKLRFIPKSYEDLDRLKKICEIREKIAINKNVPVKRIIKNFEIKLFFKNKSSLKLKTKIINKVQNIELKTILNNLI